MKSASRLYEYQKLPLVPDAGYTRLLTLFPGGYDDTLRISFLIVNLGRKDHTSYEALSYAWGPDTVSDTIEVHKQGNSIGFLRITGGLSVALRHLRCSKTSRCFWIDALSINQNDDSEKNYLVSWMGRVFNEASRVVVFLGAEKRGDANAIDTIIDIGHSVDVDWHENSYEIRDDATPGLWDDVKGLQLDPDLASDIHQVISRPWFNRLWVIQEVQLAKDSGNHILQCGTKTVSWDRFRHGYWTLTVSPSGNQIMGGGSGRDQEAAHFISHKSYDIDVSDIFYGLTRYDCARPVDRLYGILGLLNTSYEVAVNYSLTIEEAFEDLQRKEIAANGLHLLRYCELSASTSDGTQWQPNRSWVPCPLSPPSYLRVAKSTPMLRFNAIYEFSLEGGLSVAGICLGHVYKIHDYSAFVSQWSRHRNLPPFLDYLMEICNNWFRGSSLRTRVEQVLSLIEVLLAGRYRDENGEDWSFPQRRFVKNIVARHFDIGQEIYCTVPLAPPQEVELASEGDRLLRKLIETLSYRPVLFITNRNQIGAGPAATRKEDEVCPVFGVPHYLLLRPMNRGHRVVGATYIAGEAAAQSVLGELPFNIRFIYEGGGKTRHTFFDYYKQKAVRDPRLKDHDIEDLAPQDEDVVFGDLSLGFSKWRAMQVPVQMFELL